MPKSTLLGMVIVGAAFSLQARAATFHADDPADLKDSSPGNGICQTSKGTCTLRAALEEANALPGADVVHVKAGWYSLTLGELSITDHVQLLGPASAAVISANDKHGVFVVDSTERRTPARAQFYRLTIQDGNATSGGGIASWRSDVVIQDCIIRSNRAFTAGAGVSNEKGTLRVIRTTITDNGDPLPPGITSGLPGRSGGIENDGEAYIQDSTISGNRANRYGGMRNLGTLVMVNSTISGNIGCIDTAGLVNTGTAALNNVTVTKNQILRVESGDDSSSGGVHNTGTLLIANSILADNFHFAWKRTDCAGPFTSFGYNLFGEAAGCTIGGSSVGNLTGLKPLLGPLEDNGGETFTHALLAGSPAINAGNPASPSGEGAACGSTDQRGRLRGVGPGVGRCDMGAFEKNALPGSKKAP